MPAARTIAIVTPVLDDWESLAYLLSDIEGAFAAAAEPVRLHVVAVDDGSTAAFDPAAITLKHPVIAGITILRLALNLGHQRAIAVGLAELSTRDDIEGVFVMDRSSSPAGPAGPRHAPFAWATSSTRRCSAC
jgi:hypothetical protein